MPSPLIGDKRFRNDAVRLADLTVNTTTLDGYEFSNCRILGPAVIYVHDSEISHCTWDAPGVDAIFWEVPPTRQIIVGAIEVVNCVFSNCVLSGIGIAGSAELRDMLERGFSSP